MLDEIFASASAYRTHALKRTGVDRLGEHIAKTYDVDVTGTEQLDGGVFRVDVASKPTFVARLFSRFRPEQVVAAEAAVLDLLEQQDFPAERAVPNAVSSFEDQPVLVTTFVEGVNARGDMSLETLQRLGGLLGRLHSMPQQAGWPPGGAWHTLSIDGGTRADDVARLKSLLADVQRSAPADQAEGFATLQDALDRLDVGEGLPQALTHPDFVPANVMKAPSGDLVLIDWTGAGLAPRVLSLGWLLSSTRGDPTLIDAVVASYREHITLEPDELERLPDAIMGFAFILGCWGVIYWSAPPTQAADQLPGARSYADTIATRARAAFASPGKT